MFGLAEPLKSNYLEKPDSSKGCDMTGIRRTKDYEDLRCFSCGYRGKDYYPNMDLVCCPKCRSDNIRIVLADKCADYEPDDTFKRLEQNATLKCWFCNYSGETYVEDVNTEIRCPICRGLTVRIDRYSGNRDFELQLAKGIIEDLVEMLEEIWVGCGEFNADLTFEEIDCLLYKAKEFVDWPVPYKHPTKNLRGGKTSSGLNDSTPS